jgi:hypothetical protein
MEGYLMNTMLKLTALPLLLGAVALAGCGKKNPPVPDDAPMSQGASGTAMPAPSEAGAAVGEAAGTVVQASKDAASKAKRLSNEAADSAKSAAASTKKAGQDFKQGVRQGYDKSTE